MNTGGIVVTVNISPADWGDAIKNGLMTISNARALANLKPKRSLPAWFICVEAPT